MDQKTQAFCYLFFVTLISVPIAITEILLSLTNTDCDYEDPLGLNVSVYLLGAGINALVFIFSLNLIAFGEISQNHWVSFLASITLISSVLFTIPWFIIGGIILFRSNIDCINEGATMVVFALVIWCLGAFQLLMGTRTEIN